MASARKLPSGRWQGIYRDAARKRHTQSWPTKTAALTWARDGEAHVRSGVHRDPRAGHITLGEWHRRWEAARVVEDSTRRRDRTYAKDVLPRWSAWPLAAITRMECQGWVRTLEEAGRGPEAIGSAVQLLVSVLEAAVEENLIPSNPARRLRLPASAKQPDRILTVEEEDALLPVMPTEQDRAVVAVLLDTGLRYGELAGLHGHRVDLLRKELHVVEVLTQAGVIKAYPKSRKSHRVIPLEDRSVLALAKQMETSGRDGLVFRALRRSPRATTFGPLVETNWRTRAWLPAVTGCWPVVDVAGRPVLDGDGVPLLGPLPPALPTPHDLRHTTLSRLVADGVDLKTVQEFAGHESLMTTMRYLHAQPDAQDRVRAALKRIAERTRS